MHAEISFAGLQTVGIAIRCKIGFLRDKSLLNGVGLLAEAREKCDALEKRPLLRYRRPVRLRGARVRVQQMV